MKNNVILRVFLVSFFFLLIGETTINAQQSDPNTRDLGILTRWFEGSFDNDSQLWYEGRRNVPKDQVHNRMHANHKKIENSPIGAHTFYVEEYIDDDTTKISRQRIVSFKSKAPEEGIEMELYFLKDAKKYIGAYRNPTMLSALTKEDLFDLEGCNVMFQRVGEQYVGQMEDKACQFGQGDKRRYSVHDMTISKDQYWRVDRSFLVANNAFYKGHPNGIPHKMRRAATYNCDVKFYEKSYVEPDPKDVAYKNLSIHNQGGQAWVTYPKSNKTYGIQLREKEYPFYGENADFFMMRFIEKGQQRSTVLVTASPGTENLSFNIGWASCICTKATE